ncbi:MAG: argininosuccinate lyase, partial [Alphaproteobacteria bacterium]
LVKMADQKSVQLPELSLEEMQQVEPRITKAVFEVLSVQKSVASRTSYGGTSPTQVTLAIDEVSALLTELRS